MDSGETIVPDEAAFPAFLQGMPTLSEEQKEGLERPFTIQELQEAVESEQVAKSPGLDGIPYEFYKKTFVQIGGPLLESLNAMLETRELGDSLKTGVVKLLPKMKGVPMVTQLRPITLLSSDYKLLTKMLVARLLRVFPDLLQATQMCAVKGRSIFDGAAAIL